MENLFAFPSFLFAGFAFRSILPFVLKLKENLAFERTIEALTRLS
jgi:hypothetical protein